jgi:preprotein translocase subunit SecA
MMYLNRQREIVYSIRNDVLLEDDPGKILLELVEEEVEGRIGGIPLTEFKATREEDMPELESLLSLLGKCYLSLFHSTRGIV